MGDVADYETGEPKPVQNTGSSMHDLVIADFEKRRAFGLQKYGTILQAHNGRNALQDLYEELIDACVYTMQTKIEWDAMLEFLDWIIALSRVDGYDDIIAVDEGQRLTTLEDIASKAKTLRGRLEAQA